MPRLFLLLALIAIFYLLLRRIATLPPHKRRAEYLKVGLGAALVVTVLLALAGKMHWVGAALTGLLVAARQTLPLLIRLFPLLGNLQRGHASSSSPGQSTVTTATLRMHLDHESGALSGEVLDGPFKEWRLDEMIRAQLDELRSYCEDRDPESLPLLDGYLEQRFAGADDAQPRGDAPPPPSGGMSRQEALEVLGLSEDADRETIIAAHRKLMQKLHPDRGGSDYLAAKINQAKDQLLQD